LSAELLQVAFAGHNRPDDLGDTSDIAASLDEAFALLKAAGVERARLLTGLAEGADHLAVSAWRAADLGPIHAVHPFLPHPVGEDFRQDRYAIEAATWLDGANAETVGRSPHLAQTRWLIEAADLLVVVWTGQRGRGAGGTADAVRLALEHGLPVLWVRPGQNQVVRLIRPDHLPEDFGFLEFLDHLSSDGGSLVREASPEGLREALAVGGVAASADIEASELKGMLRKLDDWLHGWLWKTHWAFRRALGGRPAVSSATPAPPDDLLAQTGFSQLTAAYEAADRRANRLGSIHRSEQLLLLTAAIVATVVGSSPAVWPSLKFYAVYAELLIGLAALLLFVSSARAARHETWAEARRLAEQLRVERVGWALGLGRFASGENGLAEQSVQDVRRRAGLAEGVFDADRVSRWGDWAVAELIAGQAAYHKGQAIGSGRISHKVHMLENASGTVFIVVLAGFLAAHAFAHAQGLELKRWVEGLVIMTGAIAPAIGATCLALDATLSFREEAQRSQVMAARLVEVAAALPLTPTLGDYRHALRAAARLQISQEERWREAAIRRKLFRGG
jgi:uncharacterized protein DUF4231